MSELALLSVEGPIARLTLNRPDKRNALSPELVSALHARVDQLSKRSEAVVCVFSGAGPSFCAGMDLRAVLGDKEAPKRILGSLAELTIKIRALPCVTIAHVRGAAIGGGCGLVAACDIALTHPEAKLGYPEIDLGICPAVVAPWLIRSVGAGAARRILLEGGTMSGLRAGELGLVARVVPAAELEKEVEALAERIAGAGPVALRATKKHLNELDGAELAAQVRRGAELSAQIVAGEEAQRILAKTFGS